MVNLKLLNEKIDESGMTKVAIADKTGILRQTLYNRLEGKSDFKASEIVVISETLHLDIAERENIFFAKAVE